MAMTEIIKNNYGRLALSVVHINDLYHLGGSRWRIELISSNMSYHLKRVTVDGLEGGFMASGTLRELYLLNEAAIKAIQDYREE